ncbi:MAG: DUF3801 domain-containing protein, partial [Clostridiales bacterium]|nr:DUF3801 domain-containing protein [Clostridiales bacterium]
GTAAKEVALLLVAALKNNDKNLKLKGKARLTSMLKSGKPLEIFSVKESDLKTFVAGAKEYGIVYCVLRNPKNSPDGLCDVMVKADDAPKISRLVERFHFATVDKAKIEHELVADKAARDGAASETPVSAQGESEPNAPDVNDTEKLLNDLLGEPEGKPEQEPPQPIQAEPLTPGKEQPESRPFVQSDPTITPPSAPTSESKSKSARDTSSRPSVKEELREIKAAKKAQEAAAQGRDEQQAADKPMDTPKTNHRQPQKSGKSKSKKSKERS